MMVAALHHSFLAGRGVHFAPHLEYHVSEALTDLIHFLFHSGCDALRSCELSCFYVVATISLSYQQGI